jgi:hypothetical protein
VETEALQLQQANETLPRLAFVQLGFISSTASLLPSARYALLALEIVFFLLSLSGSPHVASNFTSGCVTYDL